VVNAELRGRRTGEDPDVTDSSFGAVLQAYRDLAAGDPSSLVRLLGANVEWSEWFGQRKLRQLDGSEAVGARLAAVSQRRRRIVVRGVSRWDGGLSLTFDRPWWDDRVLRAATLAVYASGGAFTQDLTIDDGIRRVSSRWIVAARRELTRRDHEALVALLGPR
jgi:hypothetical protein